MKPTTVQEYLDQLPEERKEAFLQLRQTILDHLPEWFEECINYGMIGYVVPKSIYPAWYHCDPKLPLPFMAIANQKWFVAFYHMWVYWNQELFNRYTSAYQLISKNKIDVWKSCTRFKKMNEIPYKLIWELVEKMSVQDCISQYESTFKKKNK